jgi:predicted RNA-binding protein YlxR (DUF448 family)
MKRLGPKGPVSKDETAPERSCFICHEKMPKSDLIRLVVHPTRGEVAVDYYQKMDGRGYYLCPTMTCIQRFCRQKGAIPKEMNREFIALLDPEKMRQEIVAFSIKRITGFLGLAYKSSNILLGYETIDELVREEKPRPKKVALLMIGRDCSHYLVEKVDRLCRDKQIPQFEFEDKATLGKSVGKDNVGVIGLINDFCLSQMMSELKKYTSLRTRQSL